MYNNQSTALFNGGLFASYRGDKYDLHFIFNNDNLKMRENGGITDDRYITDPLDMAEGKKQYASTDIPTVFNKIWNHNTSYHTFLTHRYNLGFYKNKADSVATDSIKAPTDSMEIKSEFIPVTSFIHTMELDFNGRKYITQDDAQTVNTLNIPISAMIPSTNSDAPTYGTHLAFLYVKDSTNGPRPDSPHS